MRSLRCVLLGLAVLWPSTLPAQTPAPAAPVDEHRDHRAVAPSAPAQPSPSSASPPPAAQPLPPFIPAPTDADRRAAFPDLMGHAVHDNPINYFVLFDQLEWQGGGGGAANWDTRGWIGQDLQRLWFRTEGEGRRGRLEHAEAHLLYGRAVARWWDVVAGLRQDVEPGDPQTWAAVGVQGLAPYWFELEATAYVATSGQTHLRLAAEYELLVTNRLILQPLAEVDVFGRADPGRGRGAGLSTVDAGVRLRYELRREFAPYIGATWQRRFFGTADLARAGNERRGGVRLAFGARVWF